MKFHHLGIACQDIEATSTHYLPLGYICSEIIEDPLQNVRIAFLTHSSMPMLELLSPVNENSPVVEILRKNGTTPYHICYEVNEMEATIKQLRKKRYLIVSKPKKAVAIDGRKVAFLYNSEVGLIELLEIS